MAASRTYLQRIHGDRLQTVPESLRHNLLEDTDAAARMICNVATHVGVPTF